MHTEHNMKPRRTLLTALFLLFALHAASQGVSVDATISPNVVLIGQPAVLTLSVRAPKQKQVAPPAWDIDQEIAPGIELIDAQADTVRRDNERVLRWRYTVAAYDSALYYIPPITVLVDTAHYASRSLALKVLTVEIDTAKAEEICPIADVMNLPYDGTGEWTMPRLVSFAILALTLLLLYVTVRLKDNKPIIRRIRLKPRKSAHREAMEKIEQIKSEGLWQGEDSKTYYTQLTDALREYIDRRYSINAKEMTSAEIIARLQEVNDPEAIAELRELFETADLVKFAKFSTQSGENNRNLLNVIEYINTTKAEEPAETRPQPSEIVVVESRSRRTLITLSVSVLVVLLVTLAALFYLVQRLVALSL